MGELENTGGEIEITALAGETFSAANINNHVEILKNQAVLRKLIYLTKTTLDACYQEQSHVAEIINTVETQIADIKGSLTKKKLNLTEEIVEFVMSTHDNFLTTDVNKYLNLTTRDNT